jgi:heat shock protein HspQ
MAKLLIRVGDVVLIKGTVVDIDEGDKHQPYCFEFDNSGDDFWCNAEIVALVERASLIKDEDSDNSDKIPSLKLRIGDKVRHKHKPEWGVGEIVKVDTVYRVVSDYDSSTHRKDMQAKYAVRYPTSDYGDWWTADVNILVGDGSEQEQKEELEFKFAVGDKVYHRHKPEWGTGEIIEVDTTGDSASDYVNDNDTVSMPCPYNVKFEGFGADWWTAEKNLIRAE